MKTNLGLPLLLLIALTQTCSAQYYYKDLISTQQNDARWRLYRDNRVKSVKLSSFEKDGNPTEGFAGEQDVSSDGARISTFTKSTGNAESWIIASYNPQGQTLRITDTSDTYRSVSEYQYDAQGRIASITNTSIETDNHFKIVEQHLWSYDASGKPSSMLKIKNGTDTTYIRFVPDEKGNTAEERASRNGSPCPPSITTTTPITASPTSSAITSRPEDSSPTMCSNTATTGNYPPCSSSPTAATTTSNGTMNTTKKA
ncbi:RHS repeat domain-containing protein [Puia sp. P3]|uniref:RHS repeat domain-containing protein n=1 Tax=Puia sp. P3 TaxID=3423952 RepID=UPI003D669E5C